MDLVSFVSGSRSCQVIGTDKYLLGRYLTGRHHVDAGCVEHAASVDWPVEVVEAGVAVDSRYRAMVLARSVCNAEYFQRYYQTEVRLHQNSEKKSSMKK